MKTHATTRTSAFVTRATDGRNNENGLQSASHEKATSSPPVAIVAAGSARRCGRVRAGQAFTGRYHLVCLLYAEMLVGRERVYILSPQHGIVRTNTEIDLGPPAPVMNGTHYPSIRRQSESLSSGDLVTLLRGQSKQYRIGTKRTVYVLGSAATLALCREVWTAAVSPDILSGCRGMGEQISRMCAQLPNGGRIDRRIDPKPCKGMDALLGDDISLGTGLKE